MERQEYLEFFLNNKKKPSSKHIYNHHNISTQSRSLHSNPRKVEKKLLPHISEEYEYKITNQLLVQKIMHPKRDKLIVQNFQKSVSRPSTRQTKSRGDTIISCLRQDQNSCQKQNQNSCHKQVKSLDRMQLKGRQPKMGSNSLYSKLKIRKELSKLKQKGIKSYEKQFNVALQNDRMGRRIVNTKSSVQQILKKTFYTYKSNSMHKDHDKQNYGSPLKNSSFIRGRQNKKYYFSGKINNGVKVFFNEVKEDPSDQVTKNRSLSHSKIIETTEENSNNMIQIPQRENNQYLTINQRKIKTSDNFRSHVIKSNQAQTQQSKLIETHYPESFRIFGKGPTILMLYDLKIVCNPPLKESQTLLFQLITHEKRITFKKNKQKSIRTPPISYAFFSNKSQQLVSNCIRFAINVSEIGDFVPLRIYRVHGVQIQQLGIIDIDLSPFRYRKSELADEQNEFLVRQMKINSRGQKLERHIITSSVSSQLRKLLLNKPVDITVSLQYKIYPKRFKNASRI